MQPTPPIKDPYGNPANMAPQSTSSSLIASVSGKRVIAKWGTLTPSFFGSTTLELHQDRVVEYTDGLVASRECHAGIAGIDSAELNSAGNPIFLVLGIATLAIFGLGILFLILYFVFRHRYLVICSNFNVMALALKGDEQQYKNFLFAVMDRANQVQLSR